MDVEHLHRSIPVHVPSPVEDFLASDDASWLTRQAGEDVELLAGQGDRRPVHLDPARRDVDGQRAITDDTALGLGPRSSEDRAHTGEQLGEPEGLRYVVVRARV